MRIQIEAVVRRVKWLTQNDAKAKLLVFSTWAEVLLLLEHALRTNGVPHVRPTTRKAFDAALETFKEETREGTGQVQTLLLLLKQGANGLNLTGAALQPLLPRLHTCHIEKPRSICRSSKLSANRRRMMLHYSSGMQTVLNG